MKRYVKTENGAAAEQYEYEFLLPGGEVDEICQICFLKIIGRSEQFLFLSTRFEWIKRKLHNIYRYRLDGLYIRLIRLFTDRRPLKNVIVMESHDDFDCNGGALYSYLLDHHYNKKYKIVWLLKNPVPRRLPENVKGYPIDRPSFMKDYYICTAKIFTADNVVTQKVRKDQKEYYLTHGGITFKNVKGLLNVPKHVDYVLSSSASYDPYVCQNYSIPYPNKKMLHFGYPSNDCFFNDSPDVFSRISKNKYDKVVLWMPTFRKLKGTDRNDSTVIQPLGIPLIESLEEYGKLNSFLREKRMFMIIKLHPNQELADLKISDMSNIKVITARRAKKLGADPSLLMKCSDAFISDYSSSAYQYLLLDRPIAFMLSDLKEYKLGFSVKNIDDFLPGTRIYDTDDLYSFLKATAEGEDRYHEDRTKLLDFLYEHKDGKACERLVKFMKL